LQINIFPDHFEKMNVGAAIRFFSLRTAAGIEAAVELGLLSRNALTTAWIINIVSLWLALITSRIKASSVTAANLEENVEFLRGFAHIVQHTTFGYKNYWKPLNSGLILSTLSHINL
jgi:hypothetical protein